ncbi:response regulator [Paenibacillus pini]|uniref:Two component transcriptional regulator n=1 Tax=Paenibacillus pini JCM 16418 TaxID=1236976 RepID=W7YL77_9BACL|nr:response regulator [Paenibacillus pini]GAF08513.1 two component transcriptional regulator [Paenibacillus pini JCM 16418]
MIQAIVVDDEFLIRERIKRFVQWDTLGFELAGEAGDGEEALELLDMVNTPVQVVLVDINMPMIDGLEFAKRARLKYPDIHFIFLTGYSNFDYVRTALQLGAVNYILKPIDMEELAETLSKVKILIDERQNMMDRTMILEANVAEVSELGKRNFLCRLLEQSQLINEEQRMEGLRNYASELLGSELIVLVVTPDQPIRIHELNLKIDMASVYAGWIETLALRNDCVVTFDDTERLVIFLPLRDKAVKGECEDTVVQELCKELMTSLREKAGMTLTMGVSRVGHIETIDRAYREALLSMRHKAVYGGDRMIRYEELPSEWKAFQLQGIREQLLIDLRLNRVEQAVNRIKDLFARFNEQPTHLDQMYFIVYELIATLNIYAEEQQMDMTEEEATSLNTAQVIEQLETPSMIEAWIVERFGTFFSRAGFQKQSPAVKLVEAAKAYIDANYSNTELDLGAIAQELYIHSNYLSRIFKAESGLSITEYVTFCRMNKAKQLLLDGHKNVEYIAEQIGYADPHYFSKCFKKHYHVPPSKFLM